jgi:hypothetical protein
LCDVGPYQLRANRFAGSGQLIVTATQRLALILLACPVVCFAANPFDSPLKIRHVRLESDPQNPRVKRQVSCFYYRSVVVKQVDYGEVGADRLALLPVVSGNATPCRGAMEPNEYVIPSDIWSGYFKGVKADYAFFDASDGTIGGLGFMVLRVFDRKVLFEDIAQHGIASIEIQEGTLKLRYQRVFAASCSVASGDSACRDGLVHDTGIAGGSLSACAQEYQTAKHTMAKSRCAAQTSRESDCVRKELSLLDEQKWNEIPTVIVYEVEVHLSREQPVIATRSDALACHPSE